jgi:hypothetical protein
MLPYLHILIRVEEDGSLHALGAFTNKEKLTAYQKETGLDENKVRLDFYNGPFEEGLEVVYAGHQRWNMDRFQLGGYFTSEGEAWNLVTQDGYVRVLRIDFTYAEEKAFEQQALELYTKLQKRWRLSSFKNLVAAEGSEKARANITLRFYEDALESLKPKTQRDTRALYAFAVLAMLLPLAIYFYASSGPDYAENVPRVSWLPEHTSDISYYRSRQVDVYEFNIRPDDFKRWAEQKGMEVKRLTSQETLSRYRAYIPTPESESAEPVVPDGAATLQQFKEWQAKISITSQSGMVAVGSDKSIAIYDIRTKKAYFEKLLNF